MNDYDDDDDDDDEECLVRFMMGNNMSVHALQ